MLGRRKYQVTSDPGSSYLEVCLREAWDHEARTLASGPRSDPGRQHLRSLISTSLGTRSIFIFIFELNLVSTLLGTGMDILRFILSHCDLWQVSSQSLTLLICNMGTIL